MPKQNNTSSSQWQIPQDPPSDPNSPPWGVLWQCPKEQAESAWIPANMLEVLAGNLEAPKPTIAPRSDGVCLLYAGLTHAFNGEPESGKSLIAQAIATQVISQHEPVLYIDFESDVRSVTRRLIDIGALEKDIANHFAYISPQTPHDNRDGQGRPVANNLALANDVFDYLLATKWTLVVIDGVEAAFSMYGLDSNKQGDVWGWQAKLPKKIAKITGAAVLMVDHVVKNKDTRGRFAVGSGAKLGAATGATYLIEPISRIGKGLSGDVKILLAKDRAGDLRRYCEPERQNLDRIATVNIDSTRADKPILFTFKAPVKQAGTFRPTGLMENISKFVEKQNEKGTTPQQGAISAQVKGRSETLQQATQTLIDEGYIKQTPGKRGAKLHTSLRPYRQKDDPLSDKFEPQPELTQD